MHAKQQILIGPYRSGKSWHLLEQAVQYCLDKSANSNNGLNQTHINDEAVIIVPSQRYRKLVENRLQQLFAKRLAEINANSLNDSLNGSSNISGLWGLKILTFQQFCEASLLRSGNFAKILPEAQRAPLLTVICKQLWQAGKIKKLASIIESSGTQSSILSLIEEWQKSGYAAQDIISYIRKNQHGKNKGNDNSLDHKEELAEIYLAYEKALAEIKCFDNHGLAFRLIDILNSKKEINWLSNFIVVDGFDRLNSLQIELLKALAKHTEKLYLAFDYEKTGENLFEEYAWKTHSYEQTQTQLADAFEFKSYANSSKPGIIDSFVASDRLAEMSIIAAKVKAAIILDNIKPEEIVVTARDLAPYKLAIDAAFQDIGIEYHLDESIKLITLPLIRFLLSLLSLSKNDFKRQEVINCLRSPYFRLSALGFNASDIESLNILSLKAKVVSSVEQWQQAIKKEARLAKAINQFFDLLTVVGRASTANNAIEYVTLAEDLIDRLLDLSSVIGDDSDPITVWKQKEALAQFRRQLAILIQEEEIFKKLKHEHKTVSLFERLHKLIEKANLPGPAYDPNKILVTSAELVPNQKYKIIFVAGMLEGEFPAVKTNIGFLTAQEIEQWRKIGVYIYNPRMESGFEYALFASLINRADKITVSYPAADICSSKNEFVPSFFLSGLNIIAEEKVDNILSFAQADIAFNSPRNALLYYFWQGYQSSAALSAFKSPTIKAFVDNLAEKLSFAEIRSKQLLDSPINGYLLDHVAASTVKIKLPEYWNGGQLSTYGDCPFKFWLRHMLKLAPHEEPGAGLSIQDRGTFYHKALELFYKKVIDNQLSMTGEKTILEKHFDRAIIEAIDWLEKQNWFRADEFWAQEKNELAFRLHNFFTVEHERFMAENGQYEPYLVEASFGPADGYAPLTLKQNGKEIKIRGKIDRIDREINSGGSADSSAKYLRLIDYKSGSTYISREDFESGRNLQLPLYALASEKSILPGSKVSGYQYLSISTGKGLSPKKQDEASIQNDYNLLQEKVFAFVENIEKGDFSVKPSDDKVCLVCDHKKVCRVKEFPK